MRGKHPLAHLLVLAVAVATAGCERAPAVSETTGECADAHGGRVCTWAQMQDGAVVETGATIPLASIEGAPDDHAMTWPPTVSAALPIPADAVSASGFTHLTMYWEAMGHPPGPYLTPHFDFHFYLIPPEDRTAIDCSDGAKPTTLPAGYELVDITLPPEMAQMTGTPTLVGLCVPQMGMHSLLGTELTSTEPFRGSMVIGYYGQQPIFIEPMISRDMLMEKQSFTLPIPEIPGLSGPYPRQFRADYDSTAQAYRFAFSAFAPGS